MNFLLVIARYKEPLSWVKFLNVPYIVYNKGEDYIPNSVVTKPFGREAYSYLKFIVDNYDTLPDFVGFCHGIPFDHCPSLLNIVNNFRGETEFLPLTQTILKEIIPQNGGVRIIYNMAFDDGIVVSKFAAAQQFIVSKRLIRLRPKHLYQKFIDFIEHGNDAIDNFSGCMERIWTFIFSPEIQDRFTERSIKNIIANSHYCHFLVFFEPDLSWSLHYTPGLVMYNAQEFLGVILDGLIRLNPKLDIQLICKDKITKQKIEIQPPIARTVGKL